MKIYIFVFAPKIAVKQSRKIRSLIGNDKNSIKELEESAV
jgi:hypothetical protein